MKVSAEARRALWLLGNIAAAEQPLLWAPATAEEQRELQALHQQSPCDPSTFALRALAVRGNPPALASFSASVAEHCYQQPDGTRVAADGLAMLLALAFDPSGPVKPQAVEQAAVVLSKAHPNDPIAVAAHADAVAARVLSQGVDKAPLFALEAALSRYEDAIKLTTPSSGARARARLEENAGFLSLAIAARLDGKKRDPFLMRTQRHLRFALALDEQPATLATRARFDLLTGLRLSQVPQLDRLPPSPARARAACWLAAQAEASGQSAERLLAIARSDEKSPLTTPELLISPEASFDVLLDAHGLHPDAEMRAALWLAPACDPAHLPKPDKRAAAR
jgi:hypothetical protein